MIKYECFENKYNIYDFDDDKIEILFDGKHIVKKLYNGTVIKICNLTQKFSIVSKHSSDEENKDYSAKSGKNGSPKSSDHRTSHPSNTEN